MSLRPPLARDLPDFRHIFAHASAGMLLLAEDGRMILDANPKAVELMAAKRSEVVGHDLAEFLERDLDELTMFTRTVMNHGVAWTDTLTWRVGEEGPMTVAVTASGFEGPGGRMILLAMHEATTVQREEGERTQQAIDEATYYRERMQRYRRSVASAAAHQLNTPLTPLLIQVMLLEKNLGPLLGERDRRSLQMMRDNLKRLERSVARLVQFTAEAEED